MQIPAAVSTTTATQCPACASSLVTLYDEAPWCGRCDWGLDRPTEDPAAGRYFRWRNRVLLRLSARINRQLFNQLAGSALHRPGWGRAELLLVTASVVIGLSLITLAIAGVYLIVAGPFPMKALGALAVGVAVLMRPRIGRVKPMLASGDELTREAAPKLFDLLDQVAAAAGAPVPHHVLLNSEWNASAATVGLRRRRLLTLGLPMWAVLRPQERVALLGHEFGHFVNGDVRRGLGTQLALTSFGHLAMLLLPDHPDQNEETSEMSLVVKVSRIVLWPVLWTLAQLAWLIHLGTNVLGARNGQRAEYYADALAARIGGSTAAQMLADLILTTKSLAAVVASRARGRQLAEGWRVATEQTRQEHQPRLHLMRQLSLRREASPFAEHPPSALRHRMIAAQPHLPPAVVLTDGQSALIDAELARYEESCRRIIAEQY